MGGTLLLDMLSVRAYQSLIVVPSDMRGSFGVPLHGIWNTRFIMGTIKELYDFLFGHCLKPPWPTKALNAAHQVARYQSTLHCRRLRPEPSADDGKSKGAIFSLRLRLQWSYFAWKLRINTHKFQHDFFLYRSLSQDCRDSWLLKS